MDTLVVNGDHFLDGRGLPVVLEGERELLQRAMLRLSVRRGALRGAPALGSELHKLKGAREEVLERLALSYAREAIAPMTGLSVQGVRAVRTGRDALDITVTAGYGGQTYQLEVTVT